MALKAKPCDGLIKGTGNMLHTMQHVACCTAAQARTHEAERDRDALLVERDGRGLRVVYLQSKVTRRMKAGGVACRGPMIICWLPMLPGRAPEGGNSLRADASFHGRLELQTPRAPELDPCICTCVSSCKVPLQLVEPSRHLGRGVGWPPWRLYRCACGPACLRVAGPGTARP